MDDKKIILIVGLPGSGKTHLGEQLIQQYPSSIFIDDISVMVDSLTVLNDAIQSYDTIIISDTQCCIPEMLKQAKEYLEKTYPDISKMVLFFENNPKQCIQNVQLRNDGREVFQSIKNLAIIYKPEAEHLLPVYQGN